MAVKAVEDYEVIGKRLEDLRKPVFTAGGGAAGQHCRHCPVEEMVHCSKACLTEYKVLYGFDPPAEFVG